MSLGRSSWAPIERYAVGGLIRSGIPIIFQAVGILVFRPIRVTFLWARLSYSLVDISLPKRQISPPIQHRQSTVFLRGTTFPSYHLGHLITISGNIPLAIWHGAPIPNPIHPSLTHSLLGQPSPSQVAIPSPVRCPSGPLERGPRSTGPATSPSGFRHT